MRILTLALLWGGLLSHPHPAVAATCTASDVRILVRNFNLEAPLPALTGFGFPLEIAPTPGTVRLDLSTVPETAFTLFVDSVLQLDSAYSGLIDAGGNVAIPDVAVGFTVLLAQPQRVDTTAKLSTGIGAIRIGPPESAVDYVTEGAPLDFTTGIVRIAGQGLIPDAPLAGGNPVLSGLSITCQLDQIPAIESLPAAPTLSGVVAKGRFGKARGPDDVPGDSIGVNALLRLAGARPDVAAADVFVRVGAPDVAEDFMLVWVPPGTLTGKGKKLRIVDHDGSAMRLVKGRKRSGAAEASQRGALTIAAQKKGLAIRFALSGVDLCQLPAGAVLTVQIGAASASVPVTVPTRGKHTCP